MTHEEIVALAERYCRGEITAEDYFAAVDRYAEEMVRVELEAMCRRRNR